MSHLKGPVLAVPIALVLSLLCVNSSLWAAPNTGKGPATTSSETCSPWAKHASGDWCRECTKETCYLDSEGKKTANCYTTHGTTCQAYPPSGQPAPSGKKPNFQNPKPPAGSKDTMRPLDRNMPILRRGVDGEQPDTGMANPSGTSPESK